jgi:hypothetical protein
VSPQSGNLRIGSDHQYGPSPALSHRGALPPTPPMHSDSSSDGRQSPSAASISGYSVVSAPGYYFASCNPVSAINNVDPNSQRQSSSVIPRRVPMPATSMFPDPNYNVSPGQQSMSGAYDSSPMQPTPPSQVSGLFYQRQLPQVSISHNWNHHKLTNNVAVFTVVNASPNNADSFIRRKSLATPPLYLPILCGCVPPIPGPLHLPDMQQGILPTVQSQNPLTFTHGWETIQMPTPRLWEGFQCAQ